MNDLTDKERIRAAFRYLRKLGYTARMSFACCGSCGWYEIGQYIREKHDVPTDVELDSRPDIYKVVFYSRQANERFRPRSRYARRGGYDADMLCSPLYLQWTGDAQTIVEALEAQGLLVEWGGTDDHAIKVSSENVARIDAAERERTERWERRERERKARDAYPELHDDLAEAYGVA